MLCVAKDETSVDIMCRRFTYNFLRKKVDYDKSGWRDDLRQMWRLCMSDSRIQRCKTRSRCNA
jgi:hypothetical protein